MAVEFQGKCKIIKSVMETKVQAGSNYNIHTIKTNIIKEIPWDSYLPVPLGASEKWEESCEEQPYILSVCIGIIGQSTP